MLLVLSLERQTLKSRKIQTPRVMPLLTADLRCYLVFTRCLSCWKRNFSPVLKFVSLVMFVPREHYIKWCSLYKWCSSGTIFLSLLKLNWWGVNSPKHCVLSREWCFLAGLLSRRFEALVVCSGWQSWVSQELAEVGGKAWAPVWGAKPISYKIIAKVATSIL